ncbi:hypothetical protein K2173_019772 [Erythroxylum novogranatense]|uniref:riboflavin kinase n=1 Tax=Erythroxylum novogranatense TaxID=1862640 RepID=A0AAV8SMG2_9ROSI|nr:hypothetical protein K2173_019772 [Erythroxylum novogranatense]
MSCSCKSVSCNTKSKISAVILDLDGTLLDTESATREVVKDFLAKYGKELDTEREAKKRLGMTLQVSAAAIVKDYDLPLTPEQYIDQIMPIYREKWAKARALPGADRLIKHFYNHGVPFALASNSLTEYIDEKIAHQEGWKECFSVIVGSDQVKLGKPSPDIFIEAARRMGLDADQCLVIEDSLVGVRAAKAARMKVVAVPPQSEADCLSLADSTLHSLLEFQPEIWGLPPFDDLIGNALPVQPIYMSVLKEGCGIEVTDGGKSAIPYQVSGVYFGWAEVNLDKIFKVIAGIGWNNSQCTGSKHIKICVINGDSGEIPDQQMQLVLVGYIRGLNNTGTPSKDVEILEEDKFIASASLDLPIFFNYFSDTTSDQ